MSGKPYVYDRAGLSAPGKDKRIILYDAEPSHNGTRYCLLMPTIHPGEAQSVEVMAVPESLFKLYKPSHR